MGDIVGDYRRRGQVNDMGDRNGAKTIKADVPLSEMFVLCTHENTFIGRATLQWNSLTMQNAFKYL